MNSIKIQNIFLGIILVVLIQGLVFGGSNNVGTTSASITKLGISARYDGMGGACTAIVNDINSLFYNPSGLYSIDGKNASMMYVKWFEGISYQWLSYGQPLGMGVFGVGVKFLDYGDIKETDDTGLYLGTFNPKESMLTLGYGFEKYDTNFGVNLNYISSKIKNKATALSIDIGAQRLIEFGDDEMMTGITLKNIGTKLKYINEKESLPFTIVLGAGYYINNNTLTALDISIPNDNSMQLALGLEEKFVFHEKFVLKEEIELKGRIGYSTILKDTGGINWIRGGVGLGYKNYILDYTYVPFGNLGDTHRVSISAKL